MSETKKAPAKKKETTGIILVAVKHPNYGNYAFQLAMSLKATSPNVKITIAHDGAGISRLHGDKLNIFDKVIKLKENVLQVNGRSETLKFKAYLYDLSPYDNTLYLDADMLWSPKKPVSAFLEDLKDIDFTMQNRGSIDLESKDEALNTSFSIWVNTKDLKEAYNFKKGKLFNLSSELIWFKKTEKTKAFFKEVKINFASINVKHLNFNGGIPDELPFAISMIKTGLEPHQDNWRPIYWEAFDKLRLLLNPKSLYENYWGVSFGGNFQEPIIKKFHNNLAQYYCNKYGVQYVFPLKDKRSFIAERHTI